MPSITQQQLQQLINYDSLTGLFYRLGSTISIGSSRHTGYVRISVSGKYYRAHRLAWLYHYGIWPVGSIDHINGDITDNRISNLRLVTVSENNTNRLGRGYYREGNKYRSQIHVNGKRKHLGMFDTQEEAEAAYKAAKRIYHPLSIQRMSK